MRRIFILGLITLGCLLATLAGAKADEQSEAIKLEQVPSEAQKTILQETGNGKGRLGEIQKVIDDGETNYDFEVIKGKTERTLTVAVDGKLLSRQVFMREVPEAAQKTIREQSAKATLGDINRVMEEELVTYEVTMTKDGREINFSVSPEGKLLTMEVQLSETPDKVQVGIHKQAGDAAIKTIEKNTEDEDGEVTYDVEAVKDGKKISFSVDAQGVLQQD